MKRLGMASLLVAVLCAPAMAGLAGYTGWTDPETSFTWEGTSSIALDGLSASVEWVVPYDPASGLFHYVYQLTNVGTVDITKFGVLMLPSNEAQNYGNFSTGAGQVAPSGLSFDYAADPPHEVLAAYWTFASLSAGEVSECLDFWSINKPLAWNGFIQDHGDSVDGNWDLPSPDNTIPEPASLSLLAGCAVAALCRRRRRM